MTDKRRADLWGYDGRNEDRWGTDPHANASEGELAFIAGLKVTMTLGDHSGRNVSVFAGASKNFGNTTAGLNLSGTFYEGGVGTSKLSPTLFTGVLTPSLTFRLGSESESGSGTPRPLNTFNSFSGTGVYTSYKNSVTLGQNFIYSSGSTSEIGYGRSQRTSYFGITAFDTFSAGHYNDTQKIFPILWGDGNDEFWSAGLNASLTYKGFTASWTNDMYYGKSNQSALYRDDKIRNGINYDDQDKFDLSLNNAVETFNFTMPGTMLGGPRVTLGMGRTGRAAMWPSNKMHDSIKDPEDSTKHFHHLYVPTPTSTVYTLGLER